MKPALFETHCDESFRKLHGRARRVNNRNLVAVSSGQSLLGNSDHASEPENEQMGTVFLDGGKHLTMRMADQLFLGLPAEASGC